MVGLGLVSSLTEGKEKTFAVGSEPHLASSQQAREGLFSSLVSKSLEPLKMKWLPLVSALSSH